MTWFEDRYAKYEKTISDHGDIQQHADDTYDALWSEVTNVFGEAHEKKMGLRLNGSVRTRSVVMTIPSADFPPNPKYRTLTLLLSKDRRTITAKDSDGVETVLDLAVCKDGVVRLSKDGECIDNQSAARLFMEPFLFGGESPFSDHAILDSD